MLLNALEATEVGGQVILKTIVDDSAITWQVWNSAHIPADLQLRIFQKYFSTKTEIGRGHGTHVMKLVGEKYLGGKIQFVSTVADGTTFSFILQRHQLPPTH
jgi:signal transduction histidine kinase